jgi:pyruvate/2-oxoacid:ferredoxin oxidoreductase beta subunit
MTKMIKAGLLSFVLVLMLCSCSRERYREDRKNKMTRRAKVASNYLSAQAVKLTQENIKDKESIEKKNIKRKDKMQEELNKLNASNKVKITKKKEHTGKFKIY